MDGQCQDNASPVKEFSIFSDDDACKKHDNGTACQMNADMQQDGQQ
jgi:hypothetical protein